MAELALNVTCPHGLAGRLFGQSKKLLCSIQVLGVGMDRYFPGGGCQNFPLQTFFLCTSANIFFEQQLPANNFSDLFKPRSDTNRRFPFCCRQS